jgi:hypothetical protein
MLTILSETINLRDHLTDLGVDGMITREMSLKMDCETVDWIELAQDRLRGCIQKFPD